MILPALTGADAARRRLMTPKIPGMVVLVAMLSKASQRG